MMMIREVMFARSYS